MATRGTSAMAFGFVALLIYLNYRSKQSVDEFGRDRTRHLVPLSKRIDKDSLLKELEAMKAGSASGGQPVSASNEESQAIDSVLSVVTDPVKPEKLK